LDAPPLPNDFGRKLQASGGDGGCTLESVF
jgi:hypothetical protein